MIKSVKDEEEETKSSHSWSPFITREIFPIYRAWFMNPLLILGIKSLIPYQELIFRELIFPYAIEWPAGGLEILDVPPWS